MGLFTRKKAAEGSRSNAAQSINRDDKTTERGIKVLGSGCAKCNALETAVKAALAELGIDEAIDHVTDFAEIAAFGVMTTPALVVDGEVLSLGRVLSTRDAKELIGKARGLSGNIG